MQRRMDQYFASLKIIPNIDDDTNVNVTIICDNAAMNHYCISAGSTTTTATATTITNLPLVGKDIPSLRRITNYPKTKNRRHRLPINIIQQSCIILEEHISVTDDDQTSMETIDMTHRHLYSQKPHPDDNDDVIVMLTPLCWGGDGGKRRRLARAQHPSVKLPPKMPQRRQSVSGISLLDLVLGSSLLQHHVLEKEQEE